jgi:hypothetical protein
MNLLLKKATFFFLYLLRATYLRKIQPRIKSYIPMPILK